MTETTRSADGTEIAYETFGQGPVVVLTVGTLSTRRAMTGLAGMLAPHFTAVAWDRRGRGDSGDNLPTGMESELGDLAAVIEAVGGSAMAYGHSAGGVLSLEAAAAGLPITRLAIYEPPYTAATAEPGIEPDFVRIRKLVAEGRYDETVAFLLRSNGSDEAAIDAARSTPQWASMLELVPSMAYDVYLQEDGFVPVDRFRTIEIPLLAIDGGGNSLWAALATDTVASAVEGSRRLTIPGQSHNPDRRVLAPTLIEYFGGPASSGTGPAAAPTVEG